MASGSQNMTTYNARTVTGSNSAASPAGALLLSGAGRADDATGDTWIFLDSHEGTDTPWGIKHDQTNNKIHIYGNNTDSVWTRMDTGDTYILGKVGIGYDPETSGNTYKLYVNGSTYFNGNTTHNGDIIADKGRIWAYYDGESYFRARNNNTSVDILLDSADDGNHGIWSTGWWDGSTYTASGKWLIYRSTTNKVLVMGHAEATTNLYADDSSYSYTSSNPYYAHMSYNINSDNRWYLRVYPETPKTIAVDWAYDATKAGGIRDKGNSTIITAEYSGNGVSAFDWATVWSGYRLTYISKSDFMAQIRGVASGTWGITITGRLADSAHSWAATEVYNWMVARVTKTGDTMTGCLSIITNTNQGTDALLYIEQSNNNDWGIKVNKTTSYDYGIQVTCATTAAHAVQVSGRITGTTVYGAVWNDYAEFRKGLTTKGGICVYEQENGLTPTIARLQAGCRITSDTFGFAIGETEEAKTPIAVCGRVLVYPYANRQLYQPGDAVCSAPNGTVDIMTHDEIKEYPERIVGIVSEIPDYEIWHAGAQDGNHEIQVNGRIWIYVR